MSDSIKKDVSTVVKAPWLNLDGKSKSDAEIREISKSWSQETWNEYLETIEGNLKESLLKWPGSIEHFIEDYSSLLFNLEKEEKNPHLRRAVQLALKKLSFREHQVLEMVLLDKKPLRQIAEELQISRRTVRSAIQRGYAKIAEIARDRNIQLGTELSKILAAHLPPNSPPISPMGERQHFEEPKKSFFREI